MTGCVEPWSSFWELWQRKELWWRSRKSKLILLQIQYQMSRKLKFCHLIAIKYPQQLNTTVCPLNTVSWHLLLKAPKQVFWHLLYPCAVGFCNESMVSSNSFQFEREQTVKWRLGHTILSMDSNVASFSFFFSPCDHHVRYGGENIQCSFFIDFQVFWEAWNIASFERFWSCRKALTNMYTESFRCSSNCYLLISNTSVILLRIWGVLW